LTALFGGASGLALAFWGKDLLVAFISVSLPTGVYSASRNLSSILDDSTVKKIEKIAKKYLKKNPKLLDRPAGELLIEAWNQTPPIKKK
jgi:hypothetical protein